MGITKSSFNLPTGENTQLCNDEFFDSRAACTAVMNNYPPVKFICDN
jgi:hypothetical protein